MKKRDRDQNTGQNEFAMARRSFLLRTGLGLGSLSLAQLFGGSKLFGGAPASWCMPSKSRRTGHRTPAGARQARHPHPSSGSGVASGHLRIQAHAHQDAWAGNAGVGARNGPPRLSGMVAGQTSFPLVKPLAPFRQAGQSGTWVSDSFRTRGRLWTTCASFTPSLPST